MDRQDTFGFMHAGSCLTAQDKGLHKRLDCSGVKAFIHAAVIVRPWPDPVQTAVHIAVQIAGH